MQQYNADIPYLLPQAHGISVNKACPLTVKTGALNFKALPHNAAMPFIHNIRKTFIQFSRNSVHAFTSIAETSSLSEPDLAAALVSSAASLFLS